MWVSKPRGGVEGWVRCNGCLRTPPGSEDSNGKLDVPCAVGVPGWSFNRGAQTDVVCRSEVHGLSFGAKVLGLKHGAAISGPGAKVAPAAVRRCRGTGACHHHV